MRYFEVTWKSPIGVVGEDTLGEVFKQTGVELLSGTTVGFVHGPDGVIRAVCQQGHHFVCVPIDELEITREIHE